MKPILAFGISFAWFTAAFAGPVSGDKEFGEMYGLLLHFKDTCAKKVSFDWQLFDKWDARWKKTQGGTQWPVAQKAFGEAYSSAGRVAKDSGGQYCANALSLNAPVLKDVDPLEGISP